MRRFWTRIGLLATAVVLMAAVGLRVAGAAPGDGALLFQGGVAVVEAENHDVKVARSSHDWTTVAGPAGATGQAIQATPDTGARITGSIPTTSPEVGDRDLFPAAGTYQLWVRTYAVSNGNTFHAGRDGQVTAQGLSASVGSWTWVKTALSIATAGEHTVQLWMREDGLYVDRVLVAQSSTFTPSGTGPAVTPRQTTGPDITPPSLTGRSPASGATGVSAGANVVATFSEAMSPATLTASAVTLAPTAGGAALSATVTPSAGNTVATLDPVADLAPATSYTATVAGSVADAAGNPMGAPQSWSFTTAAAAPGPAAGAVLFASGLAVVEAENYDAKVARSSHDWVAGQSPAGSVAGALKAAPDNGARIEAKIPTTSPELAYRVHFPAAGTYQLWIRAYAPVNGNSFHLGRDGQVTASNVGSPVGAWSWVKQSFAVPTAGEHTVHLWMREDGWNVDRLLLAQSASYTPTGTGPAVTGRQSGDTTAPTLTGRQPPPGATGVAIGADVVATFSEAMNAATLTGTTFTLAPTAGGPAVSASIAASAGNTVFTLNPASDLAFATSYTAAVTTGATDAAGNGLAAQQSWSFTTAPAPDTTAPTLTGRQPAPAATNVAIGADVVATFSEAMSAATLTGTTFTLAPTAGGPAVSATITPSAANTVFTLNPAADLAFQTSYTATVTTGATDVAGNPIAAPQTWSFTTAPAPDTTAPTLTGRQPATGATGVAIGANVVATFSEAMSPATLSASTFTLAPTAGGPAVSATITPSSGNTVFTLDPGADLAFATSYTATVTTGATDAAGNPIVAPQTWSFTTAPAPDTTAPTLTGRQPAPGATGVAIGANVVATFSEAMSPATLTGSTFTLAPTAGGPAVSATITPSAGNTVFTLDPAADLAYETSYTATVTTGATDAAGNPIAAPQT
ncbi:MAG: hypothetical protein QOD86_574, partial [Miltoncostaeaceae bacterium]|nr:hypothetical protein [Miltoncostaeaceae bacterium]